jgi:hypothetical protein
MSFAFDVNILFKKLPNSGGSICPTNRKRDVVNAQALHIIIIRMPALCSYLLQ